MKSKAIPLMLLLVFSICAMADDAQREPAVSSDLNMPLKWNTDPAYWDKLIADQTKSSGLRIGKSDFNINGPLIDGLRRRSVPDKSLGQKIIGLPIVRLFVPQPMPYPPGGGKYFRWGESNRPWVSIAEAGGGAGADNLINHEPQNRLISIGQ